MSHFSQARDDTTRYLCAAAHKNQNFAESVVREYLVEPTRAIPPSPGVNVGVVLREAVAAIARGKQRDLVLTGLGLLVVFPFISPMLAPIAPAFEVFLEPAVIETLAYLVPTAIVLLYAVLAADHWIVWFLATKSFHRNRFDQSRRVNRWAGEWHFRELGHETYHAELKRYPLNSDEKRPSDDGAELTVYRGYEPFVGAGLRFDPWSIAYPLHPNESSERREPMPRFDLAELYSHITKELLNTGRSTSLSPGQRLSGLVPVDRVVVSATELLDHVTDPMAQKVLPNVDGAPVRSIDRLTADELASHPLEWMRYFRCFQVETWDRDIVLSMFLTLGLDEEMLYIEWTPCVLQPIAPGYREIDALNPDSWKPLWLGLKDFAMLPLTFLGRVRNGVTTLRPARGQAPDRHGARQSMRELAAQGNVDSYFQLTDVERYTKVLEARLLRTVGEFLQSRGIAVTEFMEQAQQVTNNNVHIEGSVIGSNVNTAGKSSIGPFKFKIGD